jgi:hypothetical protein
MADARRGRNNKPAFELHTLFVTPCVTCNLVREEKRSREVSPVALVKKYRRDDSCQALVEYKEELGDFNVPAKYKDTGLSVWGSHCHS